MLRIWRNYWVEWSVKRCIPAESFGFDASSGNWSVARVTAFQ